MTDTDIAIIGGGIHGSMLSASIQKVCPSLRQLTIDPEVEPLAVWNKRVQICNMHVLRSPASHNIGISFRSLLNFARQNNYGKEYFFQPYFRPRLELFQEHCKSVLRSLKRDWLPARLLHIRQRSRSGSSPEKTFLLQTDRGDLSAQYVLLAPGNSPLRIPEWGKKEQHIFHPTFSLPESHSSVCVIGGGLTAVQYALHCAQAGKSVSLLSCHPIRISQFDSNPCYIGPACKDLFSRLNDYGERRKLIKQQRYPGSIPADIHNELQQSIKKGYITFIRDRVRQLIGPDRGMYTLALENSSPLQVQGIVLATGFSTAPPMMDILNECSDAGKLPLARCNYPIPDGNLCWTDNLFLCGALAELELGPASRNIIGAHLAAKRILPYLKHREKECM